MIQTIRKAWGVPELRKKIVFTLLILLIFRIGNAIPVPYINTTLLGNYLDSMSGTVLGLYNVMSGGAFAEATVFALGVQPYINSSIIIQLLTIAIPALERLARDGGEAGKKKIASITRYATVAIALLQGFGYYMICKNYNILEQQGIWPALVIIVSFVAGSSFVMWLGEQVNEFGVGNGISIILFAGIVTRFPRMISDCVSGVTIWSAVKNGTMTEETLTAAGYSATQAKAQLSMALAPWMIPVIVIGMLALVVFIVFISNAERRLPVQYAKRVVGRKMYGGQSTHIPMKVNMSGVLPIIFAQTIASLPATIWAFIGTPEEGTVGRSIYNAIDTKSVLYLIVYFLMIIGFSYFYATIQFNPVEISNNLKRNGGFIPGVKPGKATVNYIDTIMTRITLPGSIFLALVAILPALAMKFLNIQQAFAYFYGGTSLLIMVGVILDTLKQIESYLLMRHYDGLMKTGRIQGRY